MEKIEIDRWIEKERESIRDFDIILHTYIQCRLHRYNCALSEPSSVAGYKRIIRPETETYKPI